MFNGGEWIMFIRDQVGADIALMHDSFQDWMWEETIRTIEAYDLTGNEPALFDVDATQCGL